MLLRLKQVLDAETVSSIVRSLETASYVDGRSISGHTEGVGQRNLLLPRGSTVGETAGETILRALLAHPLFGRAVRPKALIRPQIARYDVGMHYARHLDSPVMTDGRRLRTDVSLTVFLNEATAYDGGELVLETEAGARRFRGDPGDVVIYPSTYVHEVTPVTRGSRLVAVAWAESMVRGAAERKILYDLAEATDGVAADDPGSLAVITLRQCHDNLFRMWAD
jgi:PKHD-type hydroxylase